MSEGWLGKGMNGRDVDELEEPERQGKALCVGTGE